MLTIFVCVSGLPAADLGGSDELANMEDGWSLFHLCAHPSGGYFCFHIMNCRKFHLKCIIDWVSFLQCFALGVVFLFAAN